jgi:hypothetical protein
MIPFYLGYDNTIESVEEKKLKSVLNLIEYYFDIFVLVFPTYTFKYFRRIITFNKHLVTSILTWQHGEFSNKRHVTLLHHRKLVSYSGTRSPWQGLLTCDPETKQWPGLQTPTSQTSVMPRSWDHKINEKSVHIQARIHEKS